MKIRLYFKTPDAAEFAITAALKNLDRDNTGRSEIYKDSTETLRAEIEFALDKFVEYGEFVTIEIDTDKGTAIVVPVH